MEKTTTASSWQYSRRGSLLTTLEKRQVELPAPKAGEVLVKVRAAALNPFDWKFAAAVPGLIKKLPHTAGTDFAGEVVAMGSEHCDTKESAWLVKGTKVYGVLPVDETFRDGRGTLATYLIAKTTNIAPVPEGMSLMDAAELCTVGLTARSLALHVKPDDRVLILGGTTSVGLLLIQMCVAEQASHIVVSCSKEKAGASKKRGAHDFVDYKDEMEKQLKERYASAPFDVILDCVGSFTTYRACPGFLKEQGSYFNAGFSSLDHSNLARSALNFFKDGIATTLLPVQLGGTPRKFVVVGKDMDQMPHLRRYVEAGLIKPCTDSTFSFDEAPKAYEHLINGCVLGKVVVKVTDE